MVTLQISHNIARSLSQNELDCVLKLCPFSAISSSGGVPAVDAACRMCGICVKNGPPGLFSLQESADDTPQVDKSAWRGIAVYIDQTGGVVHPVSMELLGKAAELAAKVGFPVYALLIGHGLGEQARELLHYGVDEVFLYDYPELEYFLIEPYTCVFEDFVRRVKPSSVLVGATPAGRSLAPRLAARLRTGLTADCTKLDIKENSDLIQIRPAFGGNVMAQIVTPNHRPQMATVRYKIFDAPVRSETASGKITECSISRNLLASRIIPVEIKKKPPQKSISDAAVIVAAGRGVKTEKDMSLVRELAELLDAEVAATRPLTESGWVAANRQIGLSGRTVKPKLIITLGISGSVQFKAGMENSDLIISVNTDSNAHIFDVCHYAVRSDLYELVPRLIRLIKEG